MQLLRLIWPVLAALVASLLAMSVIAFFLATSFDRNSQSGESKLLAKQLTRIHESLRALADDNAWWDAAVENIHISEDHNWMEATIGETVMGFQNMGIISQSNFCSVDSDIWLQYNANGVRCRRALRRS